MPTSALARRAAGSAAPTASGRARGARPAGARAVCVGRQKKIRTRAAPMGTPEWRFRKWRKAVSSGVLSLHAARCFGHQPSHWQGAECARPPPLDTLAAQCKPTPLKHDAPTVSSQARPRPQRAGLPTCTPRGRLPPAQVRCSRGAWSTLCARVGPARTGRARADVFFAPPCIGRRVCRPSRACHRPTLTLNKLEKKKKTTGPAHRHRTLRHRGRAHPHPARSLEGRGRRRVRARRVQGQW
jgi:hypothetical protein